MSPGPAWTGSSPTTRRGRFPEGPRPRRPQDWRWRRGLTAVELVISIAVLGSLGLVLLGLFRGGVLSSGRSAEQVFILSNARKALSGSGPFNGIVWEAQQAVSVKSLSPNSLALENAEGVENAYSLSEKGDLVSTRLGSSEIRAQGLSGLSLGYYERDANFRVVESSAPAGAGLVVVSFAAQGKNRKFQFLSGAKLMNHR